MNMGKISPKLLERLSDKDTGRKEKVVIILNREIYEGPGSITSEINDMEDGGTLHSLTTTIVATVSHASIAKASDCFATQEIKLAEETEGVPSQSRDPVNNGVGC